MDAEQLARIERRREPARERQRRRTADSTAGERGTGESLLRPSYSFHVERIWHWFYMQPCTCVSISQNVVVVLFAQRNETRSKETELRNECLSLRNRPVLLAARTP